MNYSGVVAMVLSRKGLVFGFFLLNQLFSSTVLAEGEKTAPDPGANVSVSQPDKGAVHHIESLGINLQILDGWIPEEGVMGMSLVVRPPKETKVVYDKVTYRPNLTVVAMHEPAPIDEEEVKVLKESIQKDISAGAGVASVSIDSHSFFDYKNKNDGLAVYSSFEMGEAMMSQLHIYVSGNKNRFLLTYTDLSSKFQDEDHMNSIWAMMTSIDIVGEPPLRYKNLMILSVIIFGVLFSGVMLSWLRRRRAARELNEFDFQVAKSDDSSDDYAAFTSETWDMDLPETHLAQQVSEVSEF